MYTAKKRIYLNADRTKVCYEGDNDAAFLLVCAGGQLENAIARQWGLIQDAPAKPEQKQEEPQESKAIVEAPENKAVFPQENKRRK